MINYPNKKTIANQKKEYVNYGNRGMRLEEAINITNNYYLQTNTAVIYKKPTPIQIIKLDSQKGRITDAFFKSASTTDYNGIYKGRYIDFEAKETQNKTSFPLANIGHHQVQHLQKVKEHGAIAFVIISFTKLNEIYLLDASYIVECYKNDEKKSIPYTYIKEHGHLIKESFFQRVDYLKIIDEYYL
jgi:recombination protein U